MMRKHALFDQPQTRCVNVMTAPAKSRLRHAVLKLRHRPGAIDNDRASAAKVVQRIGIQDIKARRRDPSIKFCCQSFRLRDISSAYQDFALHGLPQLRYNHPSGCAITADNAESEGLIHYLDTKDCT